jgi:hypothetical protein
METTYIVTGRHRTGTSMMMRCLDKASDLIAEYDQKQDEDMKRLHANGEVYHPNPNGYYLSKEEVNPQDIPGGLIKLSTRNLDWLKTQVGNYKVIWMLRDEQMRLQSWLKAFGYEERPEYQDIYQKNELDLLGRSDCKFTFVRYEDVVLDPAKEFTRIKEAGWPIDVQVAASLVDESLYRNRTND